MAFFGKGLFDDIDATRGLLSAPVAPAAPSGLLGASWDQFYQPYFNTGSYMDRPNDLNLELREGNAGELANLIGFKGQTTAPINYTQSGMTESGDAQFPQTGNAYTPELLKALEGYSFQPADPYRTAVIDQSGQNLGTFKSGDEESAFDKFAWQAIPLAIAAIGGPHLAAGFGGGITGGALAGGTFGGVNAAMNDGNILKGILTGGLTGGAIAGIAPMFQGGPAPGNGAFLGEGVSSGIPEWDAAFSGGPMGQAPISGIPPFNASDFEASMSQMTQPTPSSLPMPDFAQASMPGFSDIPGIQLSPQELQIPQMQMPSPASLLPDLSAYSVPIPSPQKPTTYDDLRAAEKSDMGQTAGNIPKTVDMGGLGGTMATGGMLGQLGGTIADAAKWMKDNPMLGKLLMSGGMGMLSSAGSGSSSGAAQQDYGPAKQWGSPLQQGLLGNVQQTMPAAIQQRPAGLLAQGNANSGAWRFLGGK